MDDVEGASARHDEVGLWYDVLDHVDTVADRFELSGWSLGVPADGGLHAYTRGFSTCTCASYARLETVHLPGPVTFVTGRDQYFRTRDETHRLYPLAVGIDGGTRHDAAAVLALRSSPVVVHGFLALHFGSPRSFELAERERLERLTSSIAVALPMPRVGGMPRPRPLVPPLLQHRRDGRPAVAEAMSTRNVHWPLTRL